MKFKIGDLVKIKKDINMYHNWNALMDVYNNKVCIITRIYAKSDSYEIKPYKWYDENASIWLWSHTVFIKLTPEQVMLEML